MPKGERTSIARAMPGDENAAKRRRITRAITKVAGLIPDGYELFVTADGGTLYPRHTLTELVAPGRAPGDQS